MCIHSSSFKVLRMKSELSDVFLLSYATCFLKKYILCGSYFSNEEPDDSFFSHSSVLFLVKRYVVLFYMKLDYFINVSNDRCFGKSGKVKYFLIDYLPKMNSLLSCYCACLFLKECYFRKGNIL